jgi:hypothetical protein
MKNLTKSFAKKSVEKINAPITTLLTNVATSN